MTLSRRLREEMCKKLRVRDRQLQNRINAFAADRMIPDRDMALLIMAYEKRINVRAPRYKISKDKLDRFAEELKAQKVTATPIVIQRKGVRTALTPTRRLLKFKGKYPDIFYERLEDEINAAYSNPDLPNAVLMLSRKLIENLVYNLLQYKFSGSDVNQYFDTAHRRPHDFGVLLDNLKDQTKSFPLDLHDPIKKFLNLAQPFRKDANSKVHNMMDYLERTSQIKSLKIPEMTQILLKLIECVKT